MSAPPVLIVPVGDPAGIGPEVAVRATFELRALASLVLVGDATRLGARVRELGANGRVLPASAPLVLDAGAIGIVDAGAVGDDVVQARAPSRAGGQAQLAALDLAIQAVRDRRADAIVTGPTSKAAINLAGVPFVGQTEHLARATGLRDDDVTMLFLGPRLRVALATTHVAVRELASEVTATRIERAIRHLARALVALGVDRPRIVCAGLNPHAGEGGLFGDEDERVLASAVRAAAAQAPFADAHASLVGPRPAEAAFRDAVSGRADGVVAMFHDQATIASKLVDWGEAVNVTWGLPFVRTSVDHGVAYDAAARGDALADGMKAALLMALRLVASGAPR